MATELVAMEPTVPSLVDRYFTRWYKADVKGKPCEDHCILQHSNRICVITLAEAHPVLQSGKTIKSISYQISTNCSRLQNKVSGKFKREKVQDGGGRAIHATYLHEFPMSILVGFCQKLPQISLKYMKQ
ncbi:hypothetical protein HJG60_004831 [Phyllostomus discolor]|uniref:Protein Simiate-like n=1 Tax=Phyllostomus discolor TaxID=89673 RepID=A0A834B814_9CHIR|nr:hypothetical protein HJG60_004831 [Phyllostomus discolor]